VAELPSFPAHLVGQDFKEAYDTTCPGCQKPLKVKPSLFMTHFGINQGGGICPACRVSFHLGICTDGEMYSSLRCSDLECDVQEEARDA
jgi:hypothetical protein